MQGFAGKVAVVTGAGRESARRWRSSWADPAPAWRSATSTPTDSRVTEERLKAIGAQVKADRLDVTEREAFLLYADGVKEHFGKVNQIYNNAGIAFTGDVEVTPFKDIERVMDVDFWGVVNGTKAFLPHLIASGDGHVVNISSVFGLFSVPGQAAYNSAKFAVRGFTEALRQEMMLASHPVKVTTVHPGGIKTAIARNATVAEGLDQASLAECSTRWPGRHRSRPRRSFWRASPEPGPRAGRAGRQGPRPVVRIDRFGLSSGSSDRSSDGADLSLNAQRVRGQPVPRPPRADRHPRATCGACPPAAPVSSTPATSLIARSCC